MPARKLILVRHAHRETKDRRLDNSLSEKGWKQEALLRAHFFERCKNIPPKELDFQSSPKTRCVETIEALSKCLEKKLHIENLLTERQADEDSKAFQSRIDQFIDKFKSSEALIVFACSHGDLIPEIVRTTADIHLHIGKAGWVELSLEKNKWKIDELVAHWKDLKRL